jgi:RNA-directed DNA polymerase
VRRVTLAKRMTRKLGEIKKELKARMHDPLSKTGKWLASVLRGASHYYAVPGNMKSLRAYYTAIYRMWLRSNRHRSHKGRQRWNWDHIILT